METGVVIRNMGTQSTRETMAGCARAIEEMGFDSVSGRRSYRHSAGRRRRSRRSAIWMSCPAWLGSLASPNRSSSSPCLDLALSRGPVDGEADRKNPRVKRQSLADGNGHRLDGPEFKALGLNRHSRGRVSDETLAFLNDLLCRARGEANGQKFLFKPRPPKPPFGLAARAPHALRAVRRIR